MKLQPYQDPTNKRWYWAAPYGDIVKEYHLPLAVYNELREDKEYCGSCRQELRTSGTRKGFDTKESAMNAAKVALTWAKRSVENIELE